MSAKLEVDAGEMADESAVCGALSVARQGIPRWLTLLLATACGLIVANLYYAQPLAGPISRALGLSPVAAGLIVTMTQLGYGIGLLLIVPLGDLIENRRLILTVTGACAVALIVGALARSPSQFLAAALLIGFSSVAVQIIVPYAAHLAPDATRGRVVGNVMSGLMLGIMLARPTASFIAHVSSWRVVFIFSAIVMVLLILLIGRAMPARMPVSQLRYRDLLMSMGELLTTTPILQRRSIYHAFLFGAFSLFWTTTPLLLAGPAFHLSQAGIGWFALAGVAGAISAPIAGRGADRGLSRPATVLAMLVVVVAFSMTHIGRAGSPLSLAIFVLAAVLLDFGVTANLVLGQRAIYALGAEHRGRLTGLYMAIFFGGGAIGSALGGFAFARGGWPAASSIGCALPILSLLYFATGSKRDP
ncbi:MAG: MFS transporter [Capsulimonadaceae bacterium]|nr:MFS transporter [Capsulimonadaceae bacterium]